MKICTLKYRGAFALAAKIAGLLPYGAFALQPYKLCFMFTHIVPCTYVYSHITRVRPREQYHEYSLIFDKIFL